MIAKISIDQQYSIKKITQLKGKSLWNKIAGTKIIKHMTPQEFYFESDNEDDYVDFHNRRFKWWPLKK